MRTEGPARPAAGSIDVVRLPARPALSAADFERVSTGLAATLPDLRMRELFRLRPDLLDGADYLVAATDSATDRVVGVLASRWLELPSGRTCLHILVQFVGAAYRGGSIFRRSWALHFAELLAEGHEFPEVLVLKTYNPVAYCAMQAFSGHPQAAFHPQPAGPAASAARLRSLAVEVAAAVAPGAPFDAEAGALRGIGVPPDLYPRIPACSEPAVSDYFARTVRPGDRVLCVLHARTAAARQAILAALGLGRAAVGHY
jgi:hypothetical protein